MKNNPQITQIGNTELIQSFLICVVCVICGQLFKIVCSRMSC